MQRIHIFSNWKCTCQNFFVGLKFQEDAALCDKDDIRYLEQPDKQLLTRFEYITLYSLTFHNRTFFINVLSFSLPFK